MKVNKWVNSLESVNVNSKTNGILVYLKVDSLPNAKNLTGWQSQNDWFYITLYQCRMMKSKQLLKEIDSNILDFEMIENEESLQLGIKSRQSIEQFNFSLILHRAIMVLYDRRPMN